jgi:dethiobiotin synthetase
MNLSIISNKQGAGKTLISAGIAATMQSLGYSVGYYKPIQTAAFGQSNFATSQDVTFVKKIDPNVNTNVSYILKTNAFPLLAAQKEKTKIQPEILVKDFLTLRKTNEIVLVEPCGGILTPYSESLRAIDFLQAIQSNLIIVVEQTEEAFEKTLLMVDYAKHADIKIRGIIINKYMKTDDINLKNLPALLEAYSGIPVVGVVGVIPKITSSNLIDTVLHSIDLEAVFGMQIPKLNQSFEN